MLLKDSSSETEVPARSKPKKPCSIERKDTGATALVSGNVSKTFIIDVLCENRKPLNGDHGHPSVLRQQSIISD